MPFGCDSRRPYSSTDRNTCIDWCLANDVVRNQLGENKINLQIYESWFSDHKPLWLEINYDL